MSHSAPAKAIAIAHCGGACCCSTCELNSVAAWPYPLFNPARTPEHRAHHGKAVFKHKKGKAVMYFWTVEKAEIVRGAG
jgi:hypothetical protein